MQSTSHGIHIPNLLRIILSILAVSLLGFVITGCTGDTPTPKLTPAIATPGPTPEYLQLLMPSSRVISKSNYEASRSSSLWLARGIAISIWTHRMGIAEADREWEIIQKRAALFVDGDQISNDTLVGGADGEPGSLFCLSWAPSLDVGLHDAKFQFVTDSGEVLEYHWQFYIEE